MPANDQLWVEAAKRYHLSPAHVRMARELGMNPKKLGGLANHKQEPWKAPLPEFIEGLHEDRFRKKQPNVARPMKTDGNDQTKAEQRQRPTAPASDAADDLPF